jgi:signal transduction histidine kinase
MSEALNRVFVTRYRVAGLRWVRMAFSIGGVLALAFWLVIYWRVGDQLDSHSRQAVRLILGCVLLGALFIIWWRPRIALKYYNVVVGVPAGLACFSISALAVLPDDVQSGVGSRLGMAMLLCCWLLYGFSRLPLAICCLICGISSIALYTVLSVKGEGYQIALGLYLLAGNVTGFAICRGVEVRERRLFRAGARLHEMSQRLALALRETRDASYAKSHVLAAVGHDIHQPVSSMSLFVDLLRKTGGIEGRGAKALEGIEECLKTLRSYAARIGGVVKLERGDAVLRVAKVELEAVFNRVDLLYSGMVERSNVSILFNVARSKGVVVKSNEDRLVDVVGNLVANSIKFRRKAVGARILINVRVLNRQVRVSVVDNGIGIPDSCHARIFDEFFRVGAGGPGAEVGSGLGLSIVKNIISSLPGHRLVFRSKLGFGTAFYIYVPGVFEGEGEGCNAPGNNTGFLERGDPRSAVVRRILIVEDDQGLRRALRLTFESWGLEVCVAGSFSEVTALLESTSPEFDAIATDYDLPGGGNGLDVVDLVRKAQMARIPALLMSGSLCDVDAGLLADSGVVALEKPVDVGRIRQWLQGTLLL